MEVFFNTEQFGGPRFMGNARTPKMIGEGPKDKEKSTNQLTLELLHHHERWILAGLVLFLCRLGRSSLANLRLRGHSGTQMWQLMT